MAKVNEIAEVCKANEAKMMVSTLKGFNKVAKVGQTFTTEDGKEFTVLAIEPNLVKDGKRQGLQMNFEINGEETGLKRLESLSKLVGLQWERVARTETAFNPAKFKIMNSEELTAKANRMALDFENKIKKMESLKNEITKFSVEFGILSTETSEFNSSKILSVLELRNEAAKSDALEAKAKADKAKEIKEAANGKTKADLANETIALKAANEALLAKLASLGIDPSTLNL